MSYVKFNKSVSQFKKVRKQKFYVDIQCGNIFPCTHKGLQQAMQQARELYDWDDDTNCTPFEEYFEIREFSTVLNY